MSTEDCQQPFTAETSMIDYYDRRAPEYEQMWRRNDPVRQAEQSAVAATLKESFRNRRVLEIACGTGFWTSFVAEVAEAVCAVDASPQMLALAGQKKLAAERVKFQLADAYALELIPGHFNAGLANFWFSHIPKARIEEFLLGFHRRIGPGAVVFMADNVYLPGVGGDLIRRPGLADTFKLRELADGSKHEVLKNYYDAGQLQRIFAPLTTNLTIQFGECFWSVKYQTV